MLFEVEVEVEMEMEMEMDYGALRITSRSIFGPEDLPAAPDSSEEATIKTASLRSIYALSPTSNIPGSYRLYRDTRYLLGCTHSCLDHECYM